MALPVPIGVSEFRELREKKLTYVDKTSLIIDMLDMPGVKVLLVPRPRRFGKTLNLSMLRCFFEKRADGEDLSGLFENLAVWRAGETYRAHFQRYPVIVLTFREVKARTFDACWALIKAKIQELFIEHQYLLDSGALMPQQANNFQAILDGTAEPVLYQRALGDLSNYLHRATGERVILLIDEYDQPIHDGYMNGYTREIIDFCRVFLTSGLKDNPHLERGVLTGILRVARENIFSGLNNLGVYTLLRSRFATAFGFTETEVQNLLAAAGQTDALGEVQRWYNGYRFSGHTIYNPWSVLNFLSDTDEPAQPYWLNTSGNELIRKLIEHHASRLRSEFETLLAGGGVLRTLDESVVFDRLEDDPAALWSLLVFSGYLNAEEQPRRPGSRRPTYRLSIPNEEVLLVYTDTFRGWMDKHLRARGGLGPFLRVLLEGDAEGLQEALQALAGAILSYHDTGKDRAEALYHGFVLGLLAVLEPDEYAVRSNRESGAGRPDVLIIPRLPGRAGVVLELKVAYPGQKTLEQALEEGLGQLRDKNYEAELRASGAGPIHALAVAFDGKEVRVRSASPPE